MIYTIEIGCELLVKEWLISKLGPEPIALDSTTPYGHYFFGLAMTKSTIWDYLYETEVKEYSETLTIQIKEWRRVHQGFIITPTSERLFNNFVKDKVFELLEENFAFYFDLSPTKLIIAKGIRSFCDRHDLSVKAMSYERAKKHLYRGGLRQKTV